MLALRMLLAVVVAGTCAAGTAGLGTRAAAAAGPSSVSQEIALAGLGIGSQTVQGRHGVVEAFFPPPVAPVAPSGCLVRVFFGHGQQLSRGSTMLIAVNGQPLSTVALAPGTAAGGVLEAKIPSSLLERAQPTRLQVTFDLDQPSSAGQSQLFGRVDAATLVHYSLAISASGAPGLETYPHSLLGTDATRAGTPVVRVALPSPPSLVETAGAFRVLFDLGRRAAAQRVRAGVVPLSGVQAPDTHGAGMLILGRLDHLPEAAAALAGAGWRRAGDGWIAPDGTGARPNDGMVVSAISPWDGRTPLVLVTGGTDDALGRAVSALVQPGPIPLGGGFVVAPPGGGEPTAGTDRTLRVVAPRALEAVRPGDHRVSIGFVAPAVARDGTVRLNLAGPGLAGGEAHVTLNGAPIEAVTNGPGGLQGTFAARLLRPGLNALTVSLRVEAGAPAGAAGALTATLQLPSPPHGGPDLASLPSPFFGEGAAAPRLVLGDLDQATLTTAAETAIGLGHRAVTPPGPVEAALATDPGSASAGGGLIVIDAPPAAGPLAPIAAGLPLRTAGGGLVLRDAAGQPALRLPASLAAVQEVRVGTQTALWLGGVGPDDRAVAALYEPGLDGPLAVMGQAGLVSIVPESPGGQGAAAPVPPGGWAAGVLVLVVAAILVGVVVWLLVGTRGLVG